MLLDGKGPESNSTVVVSAGANTCGAPMPAIEIAVLRNTDGTCPVVSLCRHAFTMGDGNENNVVAAD